MPTEKTVLSKEQKKSFETRFEYLRLFWQTPPVSLQRVQEFTREVADSGDPHYSSLLFHLNPNYVTPETQELLIQNILASNEPAFAGRICNLERLTKEQRARLAKKSKEKADDTH